MIHLGTNMPVVYLNPGEVYVGCGPALVHTILGSCVSVTVYSPRLHSGAICHALLPQKRGVEICPERCAICARSGGFNKVKYVDVALQYMLGKLSSLGASQDELEVKFFGGASFLDDRGEEAIGSQNVRKARQMIEMMRLKLVASDVGGSVGRKLFFYLHTGEVYLRPIQRCDPQFARNEATEYQPF